MINVATEPKVYLSKKKSGYYAKLRYTYLGKKYEKSYPLGKDKEQALVDYNKKRDLYDELSEELRKQKELDRQINKLMLKSESSEELGLKTAIANFLEVKEATAAPKTMEAYKFSLDIFYKFMIQKYSYATLGMIKALDIESFKTWLIKRNSVGTAHNRMRPVKTMLRWYYNRGELEKMPYIEMPKLSSGPPLYFTNQEFDSILEHLSEYDQEIIKMYRNTGLRLMETLHCKVRTNPNGDSFVNVDAETNKTGYERQVPCTEADEKAILYLQNKLHNDQSANKRNSYRSLVQRRFRNACRKANIDPKKHFHNLRHTYAMRLYEETKNVMIVSYNLGHTNIKTTQLYARHNPNLEIDFPDIASGKTSGKR